MTTTTIDETEYLEQLLRFDPQPYVDEDATWALTAKGARALGVDVEIAAWWSDLVVWTPYRIPKPGGAAGMWARPPKVAE